MLGTLQQLWAQLRYRIGSDEKGVTTVEYAVMLVLVAIAVITASPNIANAVTAVFSEIISAL